MSIPHIIRSWSCESINLGGFRCKGDNRLPFERYCKQCDCYSQNQYTELDQSTKQPSTPFTKELPCKD